MVYEGLVNVVSVQGAHEVIDSPMKPMLVLHPTRTCDSDAKKADASMHRQNRPQSASPNYDL
jgi:hypothetical protein